MSSEQMCFSENIQNQQLDHADHLTANSRLLILWQTEYGFQTWFPSIRFWILIQ